MRVTIPFAAIADRSLVHVEHVLTLLRRYIITYPCMESRSQVRTKKRWPPFRR